MKFYNSTSRKLKIKELTCRTIPTSLTTSIKKKKNGSTNNTVVPKVIKIMILRVIKKTKSQIILGEII